MNAPPAAASVAMTRVHAAAVRSSKNAAGVDSDPRLAASSPPTYFPALPPTVHHVAGGPAVYGENVFTWASHQTLHILRRPLERAGSTVFVFADKQKDGLPSNSRATRPSQRFGYGGGAGSRRSAVRSSSRITSIPRLSCWSSPANSRPGSLSTALSGLTPWPSMAHFLPSTV
jgi:hypothetical protein